MPGRTLGDDKWFGGLNKSAGEALSFSPRLVTDKAGVYDPKTAYTVCVYFVASGAFWGAWGGGG